MNDYRYYLICTTKNKKDNRDINFMLMFKTYRALIDYCYYCQYVFKILKYGYFSKIANKNREFDTLKELKYYLNSLLYFSKKVKELKMEDKKKWLN